MSGPDDNRTSTTNRVLLVVLGVVVVVLAAGAAFVVRGSEDTGAADQGGDQATETPSSSPSPTPTASASTGSATPSPTPATDPTPTAPSSPSTPAEPSGSSEQQAASAYVVASQAGVLRRVAGENTDVTDRPARRAYGVDEIVVYEVESAPGGTGELRVWTPQEDRALALGEGADSALLLGAGALEGRAVALVAEDVPGESRTDATDRLVAVDLRDGTRTTVDAGRASFESSWASATVLDDGEVVATRQSSAVLQLVRLAAGGREVWSTQVAGDRAAALAVVDDRVSVVAPGIADQDGRTLRVDDYGPDGQRTGRTVVELDRTLSGRVVCADWYDLDRLACTSGDGPRTVVARGEDAGAVTDLRGVGGALVTAVASTG